MEQMMRILDDGARLEIHLPSHIDPPALYGEPKMKAGMDAAHTAYEMDWTQDNMVQLATWHRDHCLWREYSSQRVMSRILMDYDFPGKFRPYHHQLRIASFLTTNHRAFCFAGMGTGKTASAIWGADYLLRTGAIKRVLVVCPKTIMYAAWGNDLKGILPDGLTHVRFLDGSKQNRINRLRSGGLWHIINFDGVKSVQTYLHEGGYDLIIVDESTAIKTHTSQRWKALNGLVESHTWVWLMTGTPCPQGPEDAYGQARMAVPWRTPRTITQWRERTTFTVSKFIRKAKDDWKVQVFDLLQPAIRISKEEAALNLPPKVSSFRDVELTADQNRMITTLRRDYQAKTMDGTLSVTAVNAAVLFGKIQQIFTGAAYADHDGDIADSERQTLTIDNADRERTMVELIRETRQDVDDDAAGNMVVGKTLVFVPFRHAGTRIMQVLADAGITAEFIHGGTSGRRRGEIIEEFQTKPYPEVLVAIPDTLSHGVTATAASTIIWYGAPTRTEVYLQANNRIDRPGQTQHMNVIHLCSGDFERKYYNNLMNNEMNQEEVLRMFNGFVDGSMKF